MPLPPNAAWEQGTEYTEWERGATAPPTHPVLIAPLLAIQPIPLAIRLPSTTKRTDALGAELGWSPTSAPPAGTQTAATPPHRVSTSRTALGALITKNRDRDRRGVVRAPAYDPATDDCFNSYRRQQGHRTWECTAPCIHPSCEQGGVTLTPPTKPTSDGDPFTDCAPCASSMNERPPYRPTLYARTLRACGHRTQMSLSQTRTITC